MKKLLVLALCTTISLISCNEYDFSGQEQIAIKENAEKVFGLIDPNQDWSSVNSGTITITADADLNEISKVQILTEAPFFNSDSKILKEAIVQKGQTVTLNYDAPNLYEQLVAACVDSEGHYYVKAFKVGETKLNFQSSSAMARTRAATRSDGGGYPNLGNVVIELSNSTTSYNADRAISDKFEFSAWKNSGWENDRLWYFSPNSSVDNGWQLEVDSKNHGRAIYRSIGDITEDDQKELSAIFSSVLSRKNENNQKILSNLDRIRNSEQVQLYNSHLVSNGNPITIIPVQMASTEIDDCQLYYYYFNPNDIPSGMSMDSYIKTLPKFSAMMCSEAQSAASGIGKSGEDFFKVYEYLLPYYGDGPFVDPAVICKTDGNIYRIKNVKTMNNEDYFLSYTTGPDRMADKVAKLYPDNSANVANQLWQIFTTPSGMAVLYNIGTQLFYVDDDTYTKFDNDITKAKDNLYKIIDKGDYCYIETYKKDGTKRGLLGSNLTSNKRVGTNKAESLGDAAKWQFIKYNGAIPEGTKNEIELGTTPFVQTGISASIPSGYYVGLMLRKYFGGNGCLYSYGQLNTEINTYGQFNTAVTTYGMQLDDTRTIMFNANGKTYIGFEDGSDCQYSDMIVEIGGHTPEVTPSKPLSQMSSPSDLQLSGIETNYLYDDEEIEGQAYMLCFEDRPIQADYDLNDVVLRCTRISETEVELSLIAAGAFDNVVIQGIPGEYEEGFKLNGREVHEIFRKQDAVDKERYINTLTGATFLSPKSAIYKIDKDMTIPQFLSKIYIENQTTGQTVEVAKTGSSPCGIIIPSDFDYPMEGESITGAYPLFTYWSRNASNYKDWYSKENTTGGTTITVKNVLKQNQ